MNELVICLHIKGLHIKGLNIVQYQMRFDIDITLNSLAFSLNIAILFLVNIRKNVI